MAYKIIFVFFLATFASNSFAYSIDAPLDTSSSLPSINNPLDALKVNLPDFNNLKLNVGTTVPSLRFLNTSNLSGNDLTSVLKTIAVLAINLFLIVIQTVAGVLKALLPFVSK